MSGKLFRGYNNKTLIGNGLIKKFCNKNFEENFSSSSCSCSSTSCSRQDLQNLWELSNQLKEIDLTNYLPLMKQFIEILSIEIPF